MAPGSSSRSSKPKPAEVAAETKRFLRRSAGTWPAGAILYTQPCSISQAHFPARPMISLAPPVFWVRDGDPVDFATSWSEANNNSKVAFICAANEKRPGGDWETGVVGYEERLCRRSNLSVHLATPKDTNYPIPSQGGLYCDPVVVFRGPHDRYEQRDPPEWRQLPVVSVVAPRWPKLRDHGMLYSFKDERDLVKLRMRAALTICVHQDIRSVVIGDFALGSARNPPQAVAELWREVFLWDPNLRGRIENVAFVFEDPGQSTVRMIYDEAVKKGRGSSSSHAAGSSSSSSSKSKSKASSSSGGGSGGFATDFDIFSYAFSSAEVTRVLTQPDDRMGVQNLMS